MTFQSLWFATKKTWQSRPFAILLPLAALLWFFWSHGHKLVLATTADGGSLPTWQELITLSALLATKFGRVTALFIGEHDPASLPPPVTAPLLVKPPTVPPVVALLLSLSLLGVSSCALFQKKVDAVTKDVETCAGPACADAATKLVPAVEVVLECDAAAGFSPSALPACALAGLDGLAVALGPDGWRVIGCITNALEKDLSRPEGVRLRASAARKMAARRAVGL